MWRHMVLSINTSWRETILSKCLNKRETGKIEDVFKTRDIISSNTKRRIFCIEILGGLHLPHASSLKYTKANS